jgi:hypothetical protein
MSRIGRRFVPQSTINRRMQAKDDRFSRLMAARAPRLPASLRPEPVPFVEVIVIELPPPDGAK